MGYYEDLFAESNLEKELKEKRDALDNAFTESAEYKAYLNSISEINHQIYEEASKRWNSVHEKYKEKNREKVRFVSKDFSYVQPIENDKINSLKESVRFLSEKDRERFLRDIIQEFKYDSLNDYENPTTTIDDIKELQKILVQCVINFVGEKNLKDIDEIHFSFDGIQDSVEQSEWVSSSDSSISAIGNQEEKDSGMIARRLIGNYY